MCGFGYPTSPGFIISSKLAMPSVIYSSHATESIVKFYVRLGARGVENNTEGEMHFDVHIDCLWPCEAEQGKDKSRFYRLRLKRSGCRGG
jgi:hypothetical protein